MRLSSTAAWRCPICPAVLPVAVQTRPCGAHVHVTLPPAALAEAFAHVWSEHPEAADNPTTPDQPETEH